MLSAAMLALAPAAARASQPTAEQLATYVNARAADALGNPARSAQLLAELARARPADAAVRRRAVIGAIAAGDFRLALQMSRGMPVAQTPLDLRLLLVADQLRAGRAARGAEILRTREGLIDASFLAPFVEAWGLAERGDRRALDVLAQVTSGSALAGQLPEHRAYIYLRLKRPQDALPFATQAIASAGGRSDRLRLALADGFLAAGDRAKALSLLDGAGPALAAGRARIAAGRPSGQAVDTAAKAFGELALDLAVSLAQMQDKGVPIAFAQVARYANPDNSAGRILLALLLEDDGRVADALSVLRSIEVSDPFASQAEDAEIRMLVNGGRTGEALERARAIVAARPDPDSLTRLASVQVELKQFQAAADSYGQALAASSRQASTDEAWMLRLYRAGALEDAGRWEEAKAELQAALAVKPDQPMLLNFLGYGKLERGEDLDAAEAMIRKASALRPDDASITDSLGWAEYKRGRLDQAIATLQRAAAAEPQQSEINEHLGDALYSAGRRFEARFAWRAALASAEDEDRARIQSKIEVGLNRANAAP